MAAMEGLREKGIGKRENEIVGTNSVRNESWMEEYC